MKKEHPTLKQFKEQIDKYEGIHEQVRLVIRLLMIRTRKLIFALTR